MTSGSRGSGRGGGAAGGEVAGDWCALPFTPNTMVCGHAHRRSLHPPLAVAPPLSLSPRGSPSPPRA